MKRVLNILFILLGLFFIIPGLVVITLGNFNMGVVFAFSVGAVFILMSVFSERLIKARGLCLFLCACMAVGVLSVGGLMVYGSIDTTDYKEDALVVLGAGVVGEKVSVVLAHRLDAAIVYAEKNPNALIIVSGAQGAQEDITEALAMKRYLVAHGMDESRIVMEEKATSTYENFVYSKQILDNLLGEDVRICFTTNGFHIFRAQAAAEKVGLCATHIAAREDIIAAPVNYLRECTAVIKFWVLGY